MKYKATNLYLTYFNLAWRIAVPLVLLVTIGRWLDISQNLKNNQFMFGGIALSLMTTVWVIRYTLKQSKVK